MAPSEVAVEVVSVGVEASVVPLSRAVSTTRQR